MGGAGIGASLDSVQRLWLPSFIPKDFLSGTRNQFARRPINPGTFVCRRHATSGPGALGGGRGKRKEADSRRRAVGAAVVGLAGVEMGRLGRRCAGSSGLVIVCIGLTASSCSHTRVLRGAEGDKWAIAAQGYTLPR
jgi:hypothetical protein